MSLQEVKEDRIDLIKEKSIELMSERLADNIEKIMERIMENEDKEIDFFMALVAQLYTKVLEAQKNGEFGRLQEIYITYLQAGIQEDKLEIQFRALDEKGYSGSCVDVIWEPAFVYPYYQDDIKYLIGALRNEIYRLTSREEQMVKLMYSSDYYKIVFIYIIRYISSFQYHKKILEIDMIEEVSILFGKIWEQGNEIYSISSVKNE